LGYERKEATVEELRRKARELVNRIEANDRWRQSECFNLIPSETTPSLLVRFCEIADPSGRYAEHRTMKGTEVYFYQGIDFIRDVEEEARDELREYFGCSEAELRTVSGQMANEVVFKAMVRFVNRDRGDTPPRRLRSVMNNALTAGGHLSSQPMGALFNFVEVDDATGSERVVNFPVREDNLYKTDTDRLLQLLEEHKPELVIFGKSMFLYREPVSCVRDAVSTWENPPVIMYDMAHVLGLYGAFQEPLAEGADVVTGSTHKTFFGPQRGVIAANMSRGHPLRKLWLDIRSRAFPGSTSNHHLGTLLALLAATYEMNAFKEAYQTQVRSNARAFAAYLKDAGVAVEGDPEDGYTETHQVLLRVSRDGEGMEIARRLEENGIVANYQALPDDETFLKASGIRMGVQEMTRFGMAEDDFGPLAQLIADVVLRDRDVKRAVREYRQQFLEMRFCLPPEEASELSARILSSLLTGPATRRSFLDSLESLNAHGA
jgi:glycine/serine hydroxymethyltransferase